MRLLNEVLDAVRTVRTLSAYHWNNADTEELCSAVSEIANELLFGASQSLIDEYGRDDAMRVLADLHSVDYDEFVKLTLQYREPIVGDEPPDDWEYPFYAMLMLTEPVTIKEEACDEQGA